MSEVLQYIVLSLYTWQNVSFSFFLWLFVLQREHLEAQPAHISTELKDQWIWIGLPMQSTVCTGSIKIDWTQLMQVESFFLFFFCFRLLFTLSVLDGISPLWSTYVTLIYTVCLILLPASFVVNSSSSRWDSPEIRRHDVIARFNSWYNIFAILSILRYAVMCKKIHHIAKNIGKNSASTNQALHNQAQCKCSGVQHAATGL